MHYREYSVGEECRPATSQGGTGYDPIAALIKYVEGCEGTEDEWKADFLLCPGDITDRASKKGFLTGWGKLKSLKTALRAQHLIASTGNHEVDSRAESSHDTSGHVEIELDPIRALQETDDYPSSIWNGEDRRWVYWGRGYEFIQVSGVLFLLINSSHYHSTTRENEYERGRIGTHIVDMLRKEIASRVKQDGIKAFVALLHHPPVNHESLDVELGRIDMTNGSKLVEVLEESQVPWLVIHGHKHHGRLILAQGEVCQPVVFAAGSAGALMKGTHGLTTRLQAYLIELIVPDPDTSVLPILQGHVRALSWIDNSWKYATDVNHGIPDRCGFSSPPVDLSNLVRSVQDHIKNSGQSFVKWGELVDSIPQLKLLMPKQMDAIRSAFQKAGIKATWRPGAGLPSDLSLLTGVQP